MAQAMGKEAASDPSEALPQFVIEKDGRFYLAAAILEYGGDSTNVTDQKDAVDQYSRMFKVAESESRLLRACELGIDADRLATAGPLGINTDED